MRTNSSQANERASAALVRFWFAASLQLPEWLSPEAAQSRGIQGTRMLGPLWTEAP